MDAMKFGALLKEIRMSKNLTQQELAEGICSKSYIVRLESGKRSPSTYILEQLSYKLGEDLQKFVIFSNYQKPFDVLNIKEKITSYRKQHKFKELFHEVNKSFNHPDFIKGDNLQFLLWHKAICHFELCHDFNISHDLLLTSLRVNHPNLETIKELFSQFIYIQEIHILNSIAKLYYDNNKTDESLDLLKHLVTKIKDSYFRFSEMDIYKIVLYNLSRYLYYEKLYEESLYFIDLLLESLLRSQTLYLLGESIYHKGTLYYHKNNLQKSRDLIIEALIIFRTTGRTDFIEIIKDDLDNKFKIGLAINEMGMPLFTNEV